MQDIAISVLMLYIIAADVNAKKSCMLMAIFLFTQQIVNIRSYI